MTSNLPPLVQAISGAIGSASANTLTYPLDLITTRVQLAPPEHTSISLGSSKGKERDLDSDSNVHEARIPSWSADTVEILSKLRAVRIFRSVIRSDGFTALYDGIITDTASTLVSNFFYFYIYSFLRKLLIRQLTRSRSISTPSTKASATKSVPPVGLTIWQDLALGFLSGVASRAMSMPLSIVTLRLQTGRQHSTNVASEKDTDSDSGGVAQTVRKIYEKEGLTGFWRGFNTSILLSLNPSITLAFFQVFRRLLALTRRRGANGKATVLDPTPVEAFFVGAVSNSIAVGLLYPLILAKTRLQVSRKSSAASSSQSAPTLRTVLLDAYRGRYPRTLGSDAKRESNFKGLYQGLNMQILKGFFNQGVTFLVKGRIEQFIVQKYIQHKLGLSTGISLPLPISMPLDQDDPHRAFESWNIVEHVGRRYL